MTTAQVVETSVTVNDNSPIQDYVNPDDQTQPTLEMTPGFKPFTTFLISCKKPSFLVNSEFTQQDGRKKRTAKRLCVTNVTGLLLLACFVVIFT